MAHQAEPIPSNTYPKVRKRLFANRSPKLLPSPNHKLAAAINGLKTKVMMTPASAINSRIGMMIIAASKTRRPRAQSFHIRYPNAGLISLRRIAAQRNGAPGPVRPQRRRREDGQTRKPLPGRHSFPRNARKRMVPREGLEPPCLSATDFESAASTIPPPGHGVHKRAHVLAFWSPSVHPFALSFVSPGTPLNSPHERSRPRPLYDPALRLDP
jgi:hypothetical protein